MCGADQARRVGWGESRAVAEGSTVSVRGMRERAEGFGPVRLGLIGCADIAWRRALPALERAPPAEQSLTTDREQTDRLLRPAGE
jgi:hypothetical protein